MNQISESLFGNPPNSRRLSEFASQFIESYLQHGLGVMSKKETEILVMHLLDECGCFDGRRNANHDLSLLLRIPETRIASLRYEGKLRYPPKDPEEYARGKLLNIIWLADPSADGKNIQIIIEDKYVRQHLTALAKRRNSVIDTSFNREIIDIQWEKLAAVMEEAFGPEIGKRFRESFKKTIDHEHKLSFAEAKKEFFKGLASGTGSAIPAIVKTIAKTLLAGDPT
jgi:hypothetical protein